MALRIIRKIVSQIVFIRLADTLAAREKVFDILMTEFDLLQIFLSVTLQSNAIELRGLLQFSKREEK